MHNNNFAKIEEYSLPKADDASGKYILLMEDDEATLEALEILIKTETPYRVASFSSEQMVLKSIEQLKSLSFALFVMDYQLPTMTGIELFDRLHAVTEFREIPAVIVTAVSPYVIEPIARQRRLPVLAKPFDIDELLGLLMAVTS